VHREVDADDLLVAGSLPTDIDGCLHAERAQPARAYASMAYDAATGSTVLFGGAGGHTVLNDTWTWGGSG
jgi:hypothetical protein